MRSLRSFLTTALFLTLSLRSLEAKIRLNDFTNDSQFVFKETFSDGTLYRSDASADGVGTLIDQPVKTLETADGNYKIIFEDAQRSGYHRPHWKFHIWVESKSGFSFFEQSRILYAVIFYDGEAEISINLDEAGKLHVIGGKDVKDVLLPWAKGTIGRGNPYHEIRGIETDYNGINYFDYSGFVGYPFNPYID